MLVQAALDGVVRAERPADERHRPVEVSAEIPCDRAGVPVGALGVVRGIHDALLGAHVRADVRSEHEQAARHPAAYFRRAAVNAAVDLLRRRAAHGETLYDEGTPALATERPVLLKEQLRRAIATLDTDDATLFLLRHVEGLSLEELAGAFGLEKNNVAVRLHRIRLRLQAELNR